MSQKIKLLVDRVPFTFDVTSSSTALDLKYAISRSFTCDIVMIDLYCYSASCRNTDPIKPFEYSASIIKSDYEKVGRLWKPHWGQVYLAAQDCKSLVTKYDYKREPLKLRVNFDFSWSSDNIRNPKIEFKDPFIIDPFLTFKEFENIMRMKLIEQKICTEEDLKRSDKYEREHYPICNIYYNANIPASTYEKASGLRNLNSTFNPRVNGDYALAYPTESKRIDYENVPILNRFKSGDTVSISWSILSPDTIHIYFGTNTNRLRLSKSQSLITFAQSQTGCYEQRQFVIETQKKGQEKTRILAKDYACNLEEILVEDDTVYLTVLKEIPMELLTDKEVEEKALNFVRSNHGMSASCRADAQKNRLFQNRERFFDLEIVLEGKESTSHKLLFTMLLLKSSDEDSLFSLWFKNREKFADATSGKMVIDMSESPFDKFDYDCNNACLASIIAYSYQQLSYDFVQPKGLIATMYCLREWASYFGLTIVASIQKCLDDRFFKEHVARWDKN